MTDQHRATPEQWAKCEEDARLWSGALNCILELRARIEALEAAPAFRVLETGERIQMNIVQDKLDRLIALDREDPTPDPAMAELHAASAEAQPAWRPLDIETTYGSEAAADAAQILRAPMVVEGTFEHGGETYRFKANATPERDPAMPELHAASAEARPTVKESLTDGGSLLEMVANAIYNVPHDSAAEARAAIREVAVHVRKHNPFFELDTPIESDVWEAVAELLEREADQ